MQTDAELGPDSLTWRHFGDRRALLMIGCIGLLQNMHPAVGASLLQHSDFFADPLDRVRRSINPVMGVVYDPPQVGTGKVVRDFHRSIKGVDANGNRYHALQPEVYWWTHVTFIELMIGAQEHFGTPFTQAQKEQLAAEGVSWWKRYGLSMRPVIDNYADLQGYWHHMIEHELTANATTDLALNPTDPRITTPKGVPAPLWRLVARFGMWLANGLLPPRARDSLGLVWTANDEKRLRLFASVVRRSWPLLPARMRYFSRAYRGMRLRRSS